MIGDVTGGIGGTAGLLVAAAHPVVEGATHVLPVILAFNTDTHHDSKYMT